MVEGEEKLRPNMSALAILSCRPNSHPFQERHLSLHEPVKIGRSVARARPAANNCIFDCKVLSRHHAIVWYENGQFFLQDTKSSNGTFVNNQRLCKGGEESPPREVFSGDLIQFGVEVMENNRRGEKITHGCIVATMTLYHPDGREAKPDPYLNAPCPPGITIQSQDLYQLAHFLQEALHREKMLEQKLSTLQQLVHNTQEASQSGWQALIDEDKLLSRLEVLENQLHTYSKNHSEDTLRQDLVSLQEEKLNYETTAKESLRRVLQEKLEAVTKLSDLERSLSNAEDECSHLKEMCENSQEELRQLAEKYQDQLKEVQDLQDRLQEAEKNQQEEAARLEKEKQELTDKIEEMMQQESILSARIESLQADNDFAKEQLAAMKAKLESMKELNEDEKISQLESDDSQAEIIPLSHKDSGPENLEAKLKETQQQIEQYKAKLEESESRLQESNDKVEQLQKELEMAQLDSKQYVAKISCLEEKLKLSDLHMNQMMENALDDMRLQLKESRKQCDSSNELIKSLQAQIEELELEVSTEKVTPDRTEEVALVGSASGGDSNVPVNGVYNHVDNSSQPSTSTSVTAYKDSDDLKELLEQAWAAQRKAEQELQKNRDDLMETRVKVKKSGEEVVQLRTQLLDSQRQAKDRADLVIDLQDQLKKAETVTKDVKLQILDLREQLETERSKHKHTHGELTDTKRHWQEAQQSAKQSHNEAEQLRKFQALKEECANLRKRIQAIEAEMKMSRRENLQLSSEYNKLQESYKQLEALKQKLESNELATRSNLTDAQKDAEQTMQEVRVVTAAHLTHSESAVTGVQQLARSSEEMTVLKKQCQEYAEEIATLRKQLADMNNDYKRLADQSKVVSMVSSIPLLLLLFAILLAVYPTLAELTATTTL